MKVVAVVEDNADPADARHREHRLPSVRDHQVGEVRGAEEGREAQSHGDCVSLYLQIRDEPEIGHGLVQLRVPDAGEGVQDF